MATSIIESDEQSIDLYNLLYSALYISELIDISLSIPGEIKSKQFNQQFIKIKNDERYSIFWFSQMFQND